MPTTFKVKFNGIRLKVRLLPSVLAVNQACAHHHKALGVKRGEIVAACYLPSKREKCDGIILLPMDGHDLNELVPHEVAHAVIRRHAGVLARDDEATANAIGVLTARIFKRINKIRVEAI